MNIPKSLMYAKSHEWIEKTGEGMVRIGLSDYAQSELGDLVFINLPEAGDMLDVGEPFADVESVKAVSEVYGPVSGEVTAINDQLLDEPELVNADAYAAWFVEVKNVAYPEDLLTAEQYEAFLKEEG